MLHTEVYGTCSGGEPILVGDPIPNDQIRQLAHDSNRSGVHEVQRASIIRFLELVLSR